MKQLTIYALLGVAVLGLFFSASLVDAYKGDYAATGSEFTEERHALMQEAFETRDYDSWKALMSMDERRPRVLEAVSAENFDVFAQARELGKSGSYQAAANLRSELGLHNGIALKEGIRKVNQERIELRRQLHVEQQDDCERGSMQRRGRV